MKTLKSNGVTNGKIGVISVNSANASTVAREAGFRKAFEGTGFTILETQYCDGDAACSEDMSANFITQGVVGLFCANKGSTVGVGFDKSDTILSLIKSGHLLAAMAQNPDVMGYEGEKLLLKH